MIETNIFFNFVVINIPMNEYQTNANQKQHRVVSMPMLVLPHANKSQKQ